jgi:hypothetical protein
MTTENFVNPTYYSLNKATIRSEYLDIGEIDVTGLITKISIHSSLNSETMYGTALFLDFVGLLENLPIRGEEQIIFEIQDSKSINQNGGSSSESKENAFRFVGFIYKVDNVSGRDTNDGLIYDVHFVSYQSFKAGTFEIARAFRDVSVSNAVQTIFDDYFLNNEEISFIPDSDRKAITIQETDGLIRCCIPKMRPEEAMTFLSKRAYSSVDTPSCTFRFFETTNGYYFVSDEELFRRAQETENIFNFTFLDSIPDRLGFFEEQLNNLEHISNVARINTFNDIYSGAYKNKIIELDILSRNVNLLNNPNVYKYLERRNDYFDVKNSDKLLDRHTESFINRIHEKQNDPSKSFLIVQTYTKDETTSDEYSLPAETYYTEIASNRTAYNKHIHSIVLEAVGAGRFDITAGDIVSLDVKKLQFGDGNEVSNLEQNKQLSGRYIVESITYDMDKEVMKNRYVLIKKDWSNYGADVEDSEL